jgi:hypothetical protein
MGIRPGISLGREDVGSLRQLKQVVMGAIWFVLIVWLLFQPKWY